MSLNNAVPAGPRSQPQSLGAPDPSQFGLPSSGAIKLGALKSGLPKSGSPQSGSLQSGALTSDVTSLVRRVRSLLESGRVTAARPLLAAIRGLGLEPNELAELEATLRLREGQPRAALEVLNAALALDESSVKLFICRCELRLELGEFADAADDAARVIIAHRDHTHAKVLLGIALMQLDHPEEAVACLAEACAAEPRRAGFRQALAQAQEACGRAGEAADTLREAIAIWPMNQGLCSAAMLLEMRRREFRSAVAIAEAACRHGIADATIFGLHGHALCSLGRHTEAIEPYREASKLAPENPTFRHLVSAASIPPTADRSPPDYIEAAFDSYADRFEAHLIELGVRIPGLILEAFDRHCHRPGNLGRVLDLGCGTGLMGLMLAGHSIAQLTGVDLSSRMIEQALAKQVYHAITQADIVTWLAMPEASLANPESSLGEWNVIIAADVFSYFGDLSVVFRLASKRLAIGGCLIFSAEAPDGLSVETNACPDWRLHRNGRYMHAEGYLRTVAGDCGFRVLEFNHETLRNEAAAAVAGFIVVLECCAG